MRVRPRRLWLGLLLVLFATGSPGAVAEAQVLPSLTGEVFTSTDLRVLDSCSARELDWVARGPAVGPRPGTFIEDGAIENNIISPGVRAEGAFRAQFELRGIDGVIYRGFKFGSVTLECTSDDNVVAFQGIVFYQLREPFAARDSGVSLVKGLVDRSLGLGVFSETFLSTADRSDPTVVSLSPLADENPVSTDHTVTATVINLLGEPVAGATVDFTVQGSVDTTGQCTTGSNGTCTFTYTGPDLPGADVITATSGEAVPGEATKVWVLPPQGAEPGKCTGGGHILHHGVLDGASFGFNAKSTGLQVHGSGNFIDHRTKTKIHLLDVTVMVITRTRATFFGNARIDGMPTTYRIDADDLGQPGRGRDAFTIQTASGYWASGILTGGNIQIH